MMITDEMIEAAQAELSGKSSWTLSRATVARVLTAALSASPAGVGVETAVTEDQVERAEWTLAEVLAGYDYTMPADGMRRVLVAALTKDATHD